MALTHELTQLIYSDDRRDSLALYVYGPDGRHNRQYFARKIRYPDEEISTTKAKARAEMAMHDGREVRITNGYDFLVFHAKGLNVIYPPTPERVAEFWKEIEA